METENKEARKPHQGKNVARLRRALGMKQEALALDLNISQQAVSLLEQKKEIDKETLLKIANTLKITPQLIEELEEDPASLVVEYNTFEDGSVANFAGKSNEGFNISDFKNIHNPIDEIIKQCEKRVALYERLMELETKNASLFQQLQDAKEE